MLSNRNRKSQPAPTLVRDRHGEDVAVYPPTLGQWVDVEKRLKGPLQTVLQRASATDILWLLAMFTRLPESEVRERFDFPAALEVVAAVNNELVTETAKRLGPRVIPTDDLLL